MLTTTTRLKLENIIIRLSEGNQVSLEERLELHKFARRFPVIASKINKNLRN